MDGVTILILIDGFLQFKTELDIVAIEKSHNPYFNRWFSAIHTEHQKKKHGTVTILILIDGFLQ